MSTIAANAALDDCTMPTTATDTRTRRGSKLGRVTALVTLLFALVAALSTAFTTFPKEATLANLHEDLAAGTVTTIQTGRAWQTQSGARALTITLGLPGGYDQTPVIRWTTPEGTWLTKLPAATNPDQLITDTARTLGATPPTVGPLGRDAADYAARASMCLWPVFAAIVIFGSATRRATKPAWVALGALPFGAGVLAYILTEHPWRTKERDKHPPVRLLWAVMAAAVANTAVIAVLASAGAPLIHR